MGKHDQDDEYAIEDLIRIRINLSQLIANPSEEITKAITHLDTLIATLITSIEIE